MANYTDNLNLKKPLQTEFYNVDDFNENFDKIDDFSKRTDNPHGVTATQVKALKIYNSFAMMNAELGTSFSVTTSIENIITALPDNTGLKADIVASDTSIYPAVYGILTIYKMRANRVEIEYVSHVNSNHYDYNARWVGQYADNTFGGFVRVFTKEHPPTAQEVGALPTSGGTLTGDLKVIKSLPRIQMNDATSSRYGVLEVGADGYVSIGNWKETADQANLQIRKPADGLADVVKLTVNGDKSYRIFGEHNIISLGVSQIVTGTYTGMGNSGANNPNTLTFKFAPRIVWVSGISTHATYKSTTIMMARGSGHERGGFNAIEGFDVVVSWSDDGVTWYAEGTDDQKRQISQHNEAGVTYYYTAIG